VATTESAESTGDKHPLQSSWSLAFKPYDRHTKEFQDHLSWLEKFQKIYTCTTVEDFWGMWNNSIGISDQCGKPDLPIGTWTFFRDMIDPAIEHKENKEGCTLHFYIEYGYNFVETLALILIGNLYNNELVGINGFSFDIKPSKGKKSGYVWKISIWLKHNKEMSHDLIEKIKEDQYLKPYIAQLDPHQDTKLWNNYD